MSAKHLLFHAAARDRVLRGATQLADALRVTLGPRSKCVLIGRAWGVPLVCDDGVTIARELELPDPEEDLGARLLRQAAVRTGDAVGDGTTTATLLAHAMFAEGLKNVVAGASAIDVRKGLEQGTQAVVAALRGLSRPVRTAAEKQQVATVSAHGDTEVGALVARAVERVGDEGVITVEESQTTETTLEVVEGLQLDRGYVSPYFVTDPERMECVLEDPLVLLHDRRIGTARELLPLLERVHEAGRPLVIVCDDVDGDALATLLLNKLHGTVSAVAIRAPEFGDRRKAVLEDLAVVTGARVVSEDLGRKLESVSMDDLGRVERVRVDRERATFIGGRGQPATLRARAEQLRHELGRSTSEYDRDKLRQRLARLAGGVAVIRVGAATEADLKHRKEAFDDAIHTTKAAIAEGIVPGAGLALLRAADALDALEARLDGDVRTGVRVLRRALEVPTRTIAENSGLDPGVVVDKMREGKFPVGLDASTGQYVDLLAVGIVDATKVVRTALENAVSVARVLLLTEATMVEHPDRKEAARLDADVG